MPVRYQRRRFEAILRRHRQERAARAQSQPQPGLVGRKEELAEPFFKRAAGLLLIVPVMVGVLAGVVAFGATMIGFLLLPVLLVARVFDMPAELAGAIGVGVLVAAGAVFLVVQFFSWPKRNAGVLVSERLCGACCYAIGEVPAGEDGVTFCPECGAAWEVPPTMSARCEECSTSLHGCVVDEEGLVVCPECETAYALTMWERLNDHDTKPPDGE